MRWRRQLRSLWLIAIFLLPAIDVCHQISKGEFEYNVDESQHAATGLFVSSALRDLPLRHPIAYTETYYAQYPALSGLIHWPPLFYLAEGMMFRIFGATVITARLTILGFALLGWIYWFRLVRQMLGGWAAAFSTIILALLPYSLLFEKTVMLEIPCLALCIVAIYYWYQYLTKEAQADLYLFALALSAAMLTKHNSVFLPLLCLASAMVLKKWHLIFHRRVLQPLLIVVLLVGPFYTLVYAVHWKTIAMDLTGMGMQSSASVRSIGRLLHVLGFYVKTPPEQIGWRLLLLAVAGLLTHRFWSKRETTALMVAWIVVCYATFTMISHKEARYSFYWAPPFVYFAAGFLTSDWALRRARILASGLAVVLLAHALVFGWRYERPYVAGFSALATRVQKANSGVILFEAPLPANFIFFLRKLDSSRHFVVLRKAIWVTRLKIAGGAVELARSVDDVRKVVEKNGVRYVVISDAAGHFEGERSLQTLVQSDSRFKLIATFLIASSEREWKNIHLFLYENTQCHPPQDQYLRVRMLTLPHEVIVPWGSLGQPVATAISSPAAAETVR
jgi:4-amino-4-deoxy-L-arabinose transferase-like glycosyltransferase